MKLKGLKRFPEYIDGCNWEEDNYEAGYNKVLETIGNLEIELDEGRLADILEKYENRIRNTLGVGSEYGVATLKHRYEAITAIVNAKGIIKVKE